VGAGREVAWVGGCTKVSSEDPLGGEDSLASLGTPFDIEGHHVVSGPTIKLPSMGWLVLRRIRVESGEHPCDGQ
jgi:hypothetical protein